MSPALITLFTKKSAIENEQFVCAIYSIKDGCFDNIGLQLARFLAGIDTSGIFWPAPNPQLRQTNTHSELAAKLVAYFKESPTRAGGVYLLNEEEAKKIGKGPFRFLIHRLSNNPADYSYKVVALYPWKKVTPKCIQSITLEAESIIDDDPQTFKGTPQEYIAKYESKNATRQLSSRTFHGDIPDDKLMNTKGDLTKLIDLIEADVVKLKALIKDDTCYKVQCGSFYDSTACLYIERIRRLLSTIPQQ